MSTGGSLPVDQRRVGRCAGAHLVERGCRRIGVVLPQEPGLELFSGPRLESVRHAVAGTGGHVVPLRPARTEEAAGALAARWPGLGLDAVFGYDDEYAALLLRALLDAGVSVPGDTAVMGAHDLLLGRLTRPRLSTVRIDMEAGRRLAELVDRLVAGPDHTPESRDLMAARAIHREST
ncbi:substrate-binding domain-containing protein [Streptomyces lavendofoliae]|uniref:substrate-binding domain-containing protein n=1 Tax=Streptomyces lavendofoliae TaxID=67314 RepID=UPI00300EB23B